MSGKNSGATIGFEEKLWKAADMMRNNMDPAEYKHVLLGLLFLKYISDSFEEIYEELQGEEYADPEEKDEYIAKNGFWVPPSARWNYIQKSAKLPTIGQILDDAMLVIERENPLLKGVLPKEYSKPALDKQRLGQIIDLISSIKLGDAQNKGKDLLGRVYEYFLGRFASAEGKGGGEFYTPKSIVELLVEMLEPYRGRIYDPACGSGGMFVQSEKFVEAHGGKIDDLSIYGQESNPTTWRLCVMNLAIRGIRGNIGPFHADSFHHDVHKDLKADFIIANPPFNISDWGGERLREDVRWNYGVPPAGNANFAWVQHFIHHLSPRGVAGFVLANGSMSSNTSNEGEIRKNIVEDDMVDCIVALPDKLFYSTGIPVCLWFLSRAKKRKGEVLFIDARQMGELVDRKHRELSLEDIAKISDVYHIWRGTKEGSYEDVKGFCKSASLEEIRRHEHILTPGRYVGVADVEEDSEPFEEKMGRLTQELGEQFAKSKELESEIRKNLEGLGWKI
ncbi:SAM-dependent DNA methyltransferase [Candidatus Woesearchaeota archaeon]|nr:SAM-dependent DNA methyltransferase [Nanoarchaeota archaeon]MCB9371030.1 SAM-dependent DNA methyltransferase [Candidatus Woesearchaeota archaeon]